MSEEIMQSVPEHLRGFFGQIKSKVTGNPVLERYQTQKLWLERVEQLRKSPLHKVLGDTWLDMNRVKGALALNLDLINVPRLLEQYKKVTGSIETNLNISDRYSEYKETLQGVELMDKSVLRKKGKLTEQEIAVCCMVSMLELARLTDSEKEPETIPSRQRVAASVSNATKYWTAW